MPYSDLHTMDHVTDSLGSILLCVIATGDNPVGTIVYSSDHVLAMDHNPVTTDMYSSDLVIVMPCHNPVSMVMYNSDQ